MVGCQVDGGTQMKINLVLQKDGAMEMDISCDIDDRRQESGQRDDLRKAMNDVANTVEFILDSRQN